MPDELDNQSGKIAGKRSPDINPSGKIAGKVLQSDEIAGKISGRDDKQVIDENKSTEAQAHSQTITSRKERIAAATAEKGLKELPMQFGDSDGDWKIIESDNLFELLYLDFTKINSIDPEIVRNNYSLLEKFWKEKKNLWESGSGQVRKAIEDKYGEKNLGNCIKILADARDQLDSIQKINDYNIKYREQRFKKGDKQLEPLFKMMLKDGEATPFEIENIFEEGQEIGLFDEEIAKIVKKNLDNKEFISSEKPIGSDLKEQLLSVSWMTNEVYKKRKQEEEDKKRNGREIFEGKFAYCLEDIGDIIFNDEGKARQFIKEGLLINAIDFFSPAKASKILEIIKKGKNDFLVYLNIVYRLNPKIPYRFSDKLAYTTAELCQFFFETPETFKFGKEHFKQGNIEIWLQETNPDAYEKLAKIIVRAENTDLAFLEFLYTFNPKLPYRFANNILVNTPQELCDQINLNKANWDSGIKELFNSSIIVWFKTTGKTGITEKWDGTKQNYAKNQNIGLEEFCHLLNEKLPYPKLRVDKHTIVFSKIQSGSVETADLLFTNETRGFLTGKFSFSKIIDGVSISSDKIAFNSAEGISSSKITLKIDSSNLLKGVGYDTVIQLETSTSQKINVPVNFKVVFPKNKFILEIGKSAAILSAIFVLFRYILSIEKPGWLNFNNKYFLHWDSPDKYFQDFSIFVWSFLLLSAFLLIGGIILINYLRSKREPKKIQKTNVK